MLIGHPKRINHHQHVVGAGYKSGEDSDADTPSITEKTKETEDSAPEHHFVAMMQPLDRHSCRDLRCIGIQFGLRHNELGIRH